MAGWGENIRDPGTRRGGLLLLVVVVEVVMVLLVVRVLTIY